MRDIPFHITGNLTDDPEIRFTTSGIAVAKFTVAQTPQRFDRATGQWVDQETTFIDVTCWRQLAENVAASLGRGKRVIAAGNLTTERWENDQGEKRSRMVLQAHSVGAELSWATADVKRMRRNEGDPNGEWASASRERPAQPAQGAQGAPDDEPPF